jgi:general secretion pathway protein G
MNEPSNRHHTIGCDNRVPRPRLLDLFRRDRRGLTLIEVVVTLAIIAVLATVALPMSEMAVKRSREMELRDALRTIRTAIDNWKDDFDRAVAEKKIIPSIDDTGYPESLEHLVKGNDWGGMYPYKRKYLRRIPLDPFDVYDMGWGLRSYRDDWDSTVYGGKDVYDVYSQSEGTALDGTIYSSW